VRGSGGVLEHEVAWGIGLSGWRRAGLTKNGVSTGEALCRWRLVGGGSVPWPGWPTPRPESIVEPGACSGRCWPGWIETGGGGYGKDLGGGRWDFGHSTLFSGWLSGEALINGKVGAGVR
jgi:hypothetical protein